MAWSTAGWRYRVLLLLCAFPYHRPDGKSDVCAHRIEGTDRLSHCTSSYAEPALEPNERVAPRDKRNRQQQIDNTCECVKCVAPHDTGASRNAEQQVCTGRPPNRSKPIARSRGWE